MIKIETVKTEQMSMRFFRFGTGAKNFVILPGLSLQSVMGAAEQVAAAYQMFAKEYTVWLFDRRSDPPEIYPVKEMAEDTTAAMDALGIKDAYVFGASQGGMMAEVIAIGRPDLVKGLVLGSTASRLPERRDGEAAGLDRWIELAEEGDIRGLTETFSRMVYTPSFYEQYKDLIFQSAEGVTKEDLRRFLILARGAEGFNAYDELGRIQCPVLVLGAAEDKVLGAEASKEIARKLGCECYIYEGYGHAAYDEAPDYKDRIYRFFDSI